MSDDPGFQPYAGRPSEQAPRSYELDPPTGNVPRIRWGRMLLLQLGAAALVAFVVPLIALRDEGDLAFILIIAVISAVIIGLVAGGLPWVGARVAHLVATSGARNRTAELVAVIVGALAGSLLLAGASAVLVGTTILLAVPVIGVPSAIGFSIWVLVAWAPYRGPPT